MGEVVGEGAKEVIEEAIEVDWGGAREVVRGNMREVYSQCDWGKYKFKKNCCTLLLLFVYLNFCFMF